MSKYGGANEILMRAKRREQINSIWSYGLSRRGEGLNPATEIHRIPLCGVGEEVRAPQVQESGEQGLGVGESY